MSIQENFRQWECSHFAPQIGERVVYLLGARAWRGICGKVTKLIPCRDDGLPIARATVKLDNGRVVTDELAAFHPVKV